MCEVGCVITKEDRAKVGDKFMTCSELGNGKGLREVRGSQRMARRLSLALRMEPCIQQRER